MQEPLLKSFWLILIYFLFVSDWMSEDSDQFEEALTSNPGEINLNSSLTGIKKLLQAFQGLGRLLLHNNNMIVVYSRGGCIKN